MTIDKFGHVLLQEDPSNQAHNAKVWQYTIATDNLKLIARHDPARFGDIGIHSRRMKSPQELLMLRIYLVQVTSCLLIRLIIRSVARQLKADNC